jgi:hypothetical protein
MAARPAVARAAGWAKMGLPWVVALMLSTAIAYMMNTAAVRVLSTDRPYDAVSTVAQDVSNLCALEVDGARYAGWDWWLPAGRSAFCSAETYPGVAGRNEMTSQLTHLGRLQATISFAAPTDIRIDLHCPNGSSQQRSADGDFISTTDVRALYKQVCA